VADSRGWAPTMRIFLIAEIIPIITNGSAFIVLDFR